MEVAARGKGFPSPRSSHQLASPCLCWIVEGLCEHDLNTGLSTQGTAGFQASSHASFWGLIILYCFKILLPVTPDGFIYVLMRWNDMVRFSTSGFWPLCIYWIQHTQGWFPLPSCQLSQQRPCLIFSLVSELKDRLQLKGSVCSENYKLFIKNPIIFLCVRPCLWSLRWNSASLEGKPNPSLCCLQQSKTTLWFG